jgi:hypothetical protein
MRTLLFVAERIRDRDQPKCVRQWPALYGRHQWYDWKVDWSVWLSRHYRWWLVECANAHHGRLVIAARGPVSYQPGSRPTGAIVETDL